MPRLSIWFIRASLVHLALGFALGALILTHKGIYVHPAVWSLRPAHIELLLFGWTVQLIMGVAFWIFPRFWRSRGDERPAWVAFALLNLGVAAVALAPLAGGAPGLVLAGRLAEAGAALAFAIHAWPRVKPVGA